MRKKQCLALLCIIISLLLFSFQENMIQDDFYISVYNTKNIDNIRNLELDDVCIIGNTEQPSVYLKTKNSLFKLNTNDSPLKGISLSDTLRKKCYGSLKQVSTFNDSMVCIINLVSFCKEDLKNKYYYIDVFAKDLIKTKTISFKTNNKGYYQANSILLSDSLLSIIDFRYNETTRFLIKNGNATFYDIKKTVDYTIDYKLLSEKFNKKTIDTKQIKNYTFYLIDSGEDYYEIWYKTIAKPKPKYLTKYFGNNRNLGISKNSIFFFQSNTLVVYSLKE